MLLQEDYDKMRQCAINGKSYRGLCEITVADINGAGRDQLVPLLSERVTGLDAMTDVTYRVVDFKGDADSTLIIEVTGRVEAVVAEIESAQLV